MRTAAMRSREVVDVVGDVVAGIHQDLSIRVADYSGCEYEVACPPVNYVFGSAQYIKARLDEMSKAGSGDSKLPMVALISPVLEDRSNPDYHSVSKVCLLIACRTSRQWSNEQRRDSSFANVLRPIYRRLLDGLVADGRIDFGYECAIPHSYSENYSYGKYGAFTASGEEVSEPIDAIDIRNLQLKIKHQTCR